MRTDRILHLIAWLLFLAAIALMVAMPE